MKNLIIWGSSGHAKVLNELFDSSEYKIVALVDNDINADSAISSAPLLIGIKELDNWLQDNISLKPFYAIIAIGGSKGRDRLIIQQQLADRDINIIKAIHAFSYIAKDVTVGMGSQILAGSIIASSVKIGNSVIVNTASSVDHECILHDGVHIGPGATVAGCVEIGSCTFIGAGAIILPYIKIGKDSIVGAGAVVTKNVDDGIVVAGNPAKLISKKNTESIN